MSCEKNILDLTLDASVPAATDVVMFTKADGTTVIRRWSTFQRAFNRVVYKCNGTEGNTVTIAALIGVALNRIVDIQRNGAGVIEIVETPPVGLEASYDNGVAGVIGFAFDLSDGEFVKVIYQ